MKTFSPSSHGHLLQVVPRLNDSALSRIVTELKREFGPVTQEQLPTSFLALLDRFECEQERETKTGSA